MGDELVGQTGPEGVSQEVDVSECMPAPVADPSPQSPAAPYLAPTAEVGPPLPSWLSPTAPMSPVALSTMGTVSDAEGAWERFRHVPARALTVAEATAVLLDLKAQGALKWKPRNILGISSMSWGGVANTFKVRRPATNGAPPSAWFAFDYKRGEECDPRMAVLIYRLATYLYTEHEFTGMDIGILREHSRAELSCHNQGRAIDVFRVRRGSETFDIKELWGGLPLRLDGRVVGQWNQQTKAFDGPPILGQKNISNLIRSGYATKMKQQRLDPELVVDAAIYQSMLGEPDPGPSSEWNEYTKKKAEELQTKLRTASTVFLGMLNFFVRESTVVDGAQAFTREPITTVWRKPLTVTESGHICHPDGSAWGGHQDHFHVQIGPTGWAQDATSTTGAAHEQVSASVRFYLYDRIAPKIIAMLDAAYRTHVTALEEDRKSFDKRKARGKFPPQALWEDQPNTKKLQRALGIASAYLDPMIRARIFTYPELRGAAEFGKPTDWQTRCGRVLRKWYQGVSAAGKGGKNPWRTQTWVLEQAANPAVTVAGARLQLVAVMHQCLDAWRNESIASED